MSKKIITAEILREWKACASGFKRFCELLPEGGDLKTASEALIADNHTDWSDWLWESCAVLDDFREQTVVTAGDNGTATAGYSGTATAGEHGVLALEYFDGNNYRKKIAQVGENGIEKDTPYKITDNEGKFVVKK